MVESPSGQQIAHAPCDREPRRRDQVVVAEALPLLRMTELLHVGKHASFGLGRVEIEVIG